MRDIDVVLMPVRLFTSMLIGWITSFGVLLLFSRHGELSAVLAGLAVLFLVPANLIYLAGEAFAPHRKWKTFVYWGWVCGLIGYFYVRLRGTEADGWGQAIVWAILLASNAAYLLLRCTVPKRRM